MSFARISTLVVITALAVYFGLNLLLPHRKIEPTLAGGPSVDQVFGTDAKPAADAGSSGPLTEAEARRIADDVGRKVGAQVAQQMLQQQAEKPAADADDEARQATQNEGRQAVPAPKPTPPPMKAKPETAKLEASQAAAVASTRPADAKPAAVKRTEVPSAARAPAVASATASWWKSKAAIGDQQLALNFAGEAGFERAIALLFTAPIGNAASAGSHIKVLNDAGNAVGGTWSQAPNPRMLLLPVAASGRYTVQLDADLGDGHGRRLGSALRGPVLVH